MADENDVKRSPSADDAKAQSPDRPAQFRLVYESADRRLCLFEDRDGHLTAVRAETLA